MPTFDNLYHKSKAISTKFKKDPRNYASKVILSLLSRFCSYGIYLSCEILLSHPKRMELLESFPENVIYENLLQNGRKFYFRVENTGSDEVFYAKIEGSPQKCSGGLFFRPPLFGNLS